MVLLLSGQPFHKQFNVLGFLPSKGDLQVVSLSRSPGIFYHSVIGRVQGPCVRLIWIDIQKNPENLWDMQIWCEYLKSGFVTPKGTYFEIGGYLYIGILGVRDNTPQDSEILIKAHTVQNRWRNAGEARVSPFQRRNHVCSAWSQCGMRVLSEKLYWEFSSKRKGRYMQRELLTRTPSDNPFPSGKGWFCALGLNAWAFRLFSSLFVYSLKMKFKGLATHGSTCIWNLQRRHKTLIFKAIRVRSIIPAIIKV